MSELDSLEDFYDFNDVEDGSEAVFADECKLAEPGLDGIEKFCVVTYNDGSVRLWGEGFGYVRTVVTYGAVRATFESDFDIVVTYSTGRVVKNPNSGKDVVLVDGPVPERPEIRCYRVGEVPELSEAVDLGLPSGTLWAPWDVGGPGVDLGIDGTDKQFPWGHVGDVEVAGPLEENGPEFVWVTYKFMSHKCLEQWYARRLGDPYLYISKYRTDHKGGVTPDFKKVLDSEDDVATVQWGADWRMPSAAQFEELFENCDVECLGMVPKEELANFPRGGGHCLNSGVCSAMYDEICEKYGIEGVPGIRLTSKINGAELFLPAVGLLGEELANSNAPGIDGRGFGHLCCYWTRELSSSCDENAVAYEAGLDPGEVGDPERGKSCGEFYCESTTYQRCFALSVRAVVNKESSLDVASSVTPSASEWEHSSAAPVKLEPLSGKVALSSDAVDLALPSGTLWAPWNVGSASPSEAGQAFTWGETSAKDVYLWETYSYLSENAQLDVAHDAATANWGSDWRMPSSEQFQELIDNCTWTWMARKGVFDVEVKGFLVTSKINNASIFLPAAGMMRDTTRRACGMEGCYWTSDIDPKAETSVTTRAKALRLEKDKIRLGCIDRSYGRSVRPVLVKKANC